MTDPAKSKRAAINAFCKACIYDRGAPGTWRAQVEGCTAQDCPLFAHRPTTTVRGSVRAVAP
jgi:hypothetical protein